MHPNDLIDPDDHDRLIANGWRHGWRSPSDTATPTFDAPAALERQALIDNMIDQDKAHLNALLQAATGDGYLNASPTIPTTPLRLV